MRCLQAALADEIDTLLARVRSRKKLLKSQVKYKAMLASELEEDMARHNKELSERDGDNSKALSVDYTVRPYCKSDLDSISPLAGHNTVSIAVPLSVHVSPNEPICPVPLSVPPLSRALV